MESLTDKKEKGENMAPSFLAVLLINIAVSLLGIYMARHVPRSDHVVKPHPANLIVGILVVLFL